MKLKKEILERFLAEVGREIGIRKQVYPRFVKTGRMDPTEADERLKTLEELYQFLKEFRDADVTIRS